MVKDSINFLDHINGKKRKLGSVCDGERAERRRNSVCVFRPEEPGHVDEGGALVSGSGEEEVRGE